MICSTSGHVEELVEQGVVVRHQNGFVSVVGTLDRGWDLDLQVGDWIRATGGPGRNGVFASSVISKWVLGPNGENQWVEIPDGRSGYKRPPELEQPAPIHQESLTGPEAIYGLSFHRCMSVSARRLLKADPTVSVVLAGAARESALRGLFARVLGNCHKIGAFAGALEKVVDFDLSSPMTRALFAGLTDEDPTTQEFWSRYETASRVLARVATEGYFADPADANNACAATEEFLAYLDALYARIRREFDAQHPPMPPPPFPPPPPPPF